MTLPGAGSPLARSAVLGLGSNLGDRHALIREAVDRLRKATTVLATSSVYESPAVGPPQPAYLNAAALVVWSASPVALLELALGVEREMGRVRRERWGPRTIDIDVLWIEGVMVREPSLVVPHPELLARPFALVPLLELVPDAIDPGTKLPFPTPSSSGLSRVAPRF